MDETSLHQQILALLQSSKRAICVNRIQSEFKVLTGSSIPILELGFRDIEDFLRSIPNVARITRNSNGELVCQPVDNPKTRQLSQMVRSQRGSKAPSFPRGGGQGRMSKPQRPVNYRPDNNYKKLDTNYSRHDNNYARSDSNFSRPDNDYSRPSKRPPLLPTPSHPNSYEIPPRFAKQSAERNVGRTTARMPNLQTASPPTTMTELLRALPPTMVTQPLRAPPPTTVTRPVTAPLPSTMARPVTASPPTMSVRSITPPCIPKQRVPAVPIIPNPSAPKVTQTHKLSLNRLLAEKQLGRASYKTTCEQNRRLGRTIYYSVVRFLDRAAQSYPMEMSTAEEAEEEAARQAIKDVGATLESINGNEELPMTSTEFIARQIFELVQDKSRGVWSHCLSNEYIEKFRERLPSNWLEIIIGDPYLDIQRVDDVKSIIYPKKNVVNNDVEIYTVRRFSDCSDTSIPSPATSSTSSLPSLESPSNILPLPESNFWNVYVSCAESTSNLYIRLIGDDYSIKYDNLATEMELYYMDCTARPPLLSDIAVGDLFAVKNEECWLRVEITELLPDNFAMCFFVDHGDFSIFSIEQLLPLEPQFRSLPFQALQCKLEYLEGVDIFDINMKLLECVVGKSLVASVVLRDDVLTIILYDTTTSEDININELLAEMVLDRMEAPLLKPGITEVFLKHVTTSGEINIYESSPTFFVLERMIELAAKKCESIDVVHVGKMYIVKHEGTYYRAINSGCSTTNLKFLLVDYGSFISACLADIHQIDERLQRIPQQFVKCRLSCVPSSLNLEWSERTSVRLCSLAPKDMPLIAKVVASVNMELPTVELFKRLPVSDELVSINQTLDLDLDIFSKRKTMTSEKIPKAIKKPESRKADDQVLANGSQKPVQFDISTWKPVEEPPPRPLSPEILLSTSRLPPIGEYIDVVINLVASPSNFMFQNWIGGEEYDILTEEMMVFYGAEGSHHIPQNFDKVHYAVSHKGTWQRTRIPQNDCFLDNEAVSVCFIDSGEHALVAMKDIRPLDKKFKKLPPQALYGKLAGIKPVHGDWTPEDCYRFKELVEGKPLVAEILSYEKSIDLTRVVMRLVDTTDPDTDIHIHKVLVEEKRACEVTNTLVR